MMDVEENIFSLTGCDEYFCDLKTKDVEIPYGSFAYPCRLKINPQAQYLSVQLHGATEGSTLPVFARWNWGSILGSHVLSICDPTVCLDKTLSIGWYLGSTEENAVIGIIAIAEHCAGMLGVEKDHIIYSGGSGGGFAAMQAAILAKDGKAVAINPQTNLLQYPSPFLNDYVQKVSGCTSFEEALDVFDCRWNVMRSLERTFANGGSPKIVIVQNKNEWHFEQHFLPFLAAFGMDLTENKTINKQLMSIVYDGPDNHGPEPSEIVKVINSDGIPFLLGESVLNNFTIPDFSVVISLENDNFFAKIEIKDELYKYACYLYKDGNAIEKIFYQENNVFIFNSHGNGRYKCLGFIRNDALETYSNYSSTIDL